MVQALAWLEYSRVMCLNLRNWICAAEISPKSRESVNKYAQEEVADLQNKTRWRVYVYHVHRQGSPQSPHWFPILK